jgi:hypothetical protein
MSEIEFKIGTSSEFFARGRKIAQLPDEKKPIPAESVVTFEESAAMPAQSVAPSSESEF